MPNPPSPTPPATGSARAPQRIAKLLARAGIASRREVERMIAEGRVALNGVKLDTPATLLVSLHGVTVDGQAVAQAAPARLFVYHKPPGLLVTERDPAGRRTIYDVLPKDLPRVVPVGRLDLNTEGLLLLTTDGGLKRQLELPASGVERSYRARAYGQVAQAQLEDLIHGIEIDGVRYGPIDANLERRTGANVWIEMTLTEGKNREVRRVLEHLGLEVSRLIRTRYGPFVLADLPSGAVGEVRQHDLVAFRKMLDKPAAARRFEPLAVAQREAPQPVAAKPAVPRPAAPAPARARPARPAAPKPGRPPRTSDPARPPRAESGARPKLSAAKPTREHPTGTRRPTRSTDAARPARPGSKPDARRGPGKPRPPKR